MADAADSKSVARKGVWVQVPPPALTVSLDWFAGWRPVASVTGSTSRDCDGAVTGASLPPSSRILHRGIAYETQPS